MESSSSRMVLRSSRRLLGCCALLLVTVMLVGFMPTSSSPVAGISSKAFSILVLLFVTSVTFHLVSVNLLWVSIINSESFLSQMIWTSERRWAYVRVMLSLCKWRLLLLEVQNEWDSQWIVLNCVWDSSKEVHICPHSDFLDWYFLEIACWGYRSRMVGSFFFGYSSR